MEMKPMHTHPTGKFVCSVEPPTTLTSARQGPLNSASQQTSAWELCVPTKCSLDMNMLRRSMFPYWLCCWWALVRRGSEGKAAKARDKAPRPTGRRPRGTHRGGEGSTRKEEQDGGRCCCADDPFAHRWPKASAAAVAGVGTGRRVGNAFVWTNSSCACK